VVKAVYFSFFLLFLLFFSFFSSRVNNTLCFVFVCFCTVFVSVNVTPDGLKAIMKLSGGDMRKCLNVLQACLQIVQCMCVCVYVCTCVRVYACMCV